MIYEYQSEDGRVGYHSQSLLNSTPPPASILLKDGAVAKRVWGTVAAPSPKGWPMTCVASGVNAEQAQDLRDHFKKVGVPTEVTAGGDPIYTSPEHRRRALKARGFFDRSCYH